MNQEINGIIILFYYLLFIILFGLKFIRKHSKIKTEKLEKPTVREEGRRNDEDNDWGRKTAQKKFRVRKEKIIARSEM